MPSNTSSSALVDVIYCSPRVHCDLREARVARLMRQAQLRSVRGYKRPRYKVRMPSTTAPHLLQREFTVALPDQVLVTDITYRCLRPISGNLFAIPQTVTIIDSQTRRGAPTVCRLRQSDPNSVV